MNTYQYFLVPKWNSVFRVLEGCCFEQVVFDGPIKGVRAKNDEEEDYWNSYNLTCYTCNPGIEIIPIKEEYYNLKKMDVNLRRA
jgi:hypothetical protein